MPTLESGVGELWDRLGHLEDVEVNRVRVLVTLVRKELVDRLLATPAVSGADGAEVNSASALTAYIESLDAYLQGPVTGYTTGSGGVTAASQMAAEGMASLLLKYATGPVPVLGLTDDLIRATALYRASFMSKWGGDVVSAVTSEVQRVIFGAQSRWDAVRNIRSALADSGGETNWGSLTKSAVRAERTALISVFNASAGRALTAGESRIPGLMAEWSAAHQARTCPKCTALNGARVKPGRRFPNAGVAPPLHHQCRCRLIPYIPD